MFLKFIKKIDLFAKRPELYYKNHSRRTSWIGRIFTFLYVIIFLLFFAYKLDRLINRIDVTVYDTNTYTGEIPSIRLDNNLFYAGIAFDLPGTNIPYIDERIYTMETKFVNQVKVDGQWQTNEKDIPMKKCELSDFGRNFQNIFSKTDLSQLLCPTNVNYTLEGYSTMDRYSYVKMNFKRCVNTTENNNHCFPLDVIQRYLYATTLNAKLEDIEIDPRNYKNPIYYLERDVPGPTYKDLYLRIYVYFQIVIIETDDNIIGFEAFSNPKVEKYLKYDTTWIIPSPNLYGDFTVNPNAPLNEITLQLAPSVLTLKRTYVKLIDVLGDVGGLIQTINMIFKIITFAIVNILYEKSLVNNLFDFDLNKKLIIFKNKKIKMYNIEFKPFHILKNPLNNLPDDTKIVDGNINDGISLDKKIINEEILDNKKIKKQRRKSENKKELCSSLSNISIYQKDNKSLILNAENNKDNSQNKNYSNYIRVYSEHKIYKQNENKENEQHKTDKNSEKNKNIIKKIKVNKFGIYFCFCCIRNINNVNNILLNEGMKLIINQLDIFHLFLQLYKNERKEQLLKMEMSAKSKKNLTTIIGCNNISFLN